MHSGDPTGGWKSRVLRHSTLGLSLGDRGQSEGKRSSPKVKASHELPDSSTSLSFCCSSAETEAQRRCVTWGGEEPPKSQLLSGLEGWKPVAWS